MEEQRRVSAPTPNFISEFMRQYQNIDPNYTGLRLPNFNVTETREVRSFYDFAAAQTRSFRNTELTIWFDSAIVPTFESLNDMNQFISYYHELYQDDKRLYQVSFSYDDDHVNLHVGSWVQELRGKMREYEEDGFVIDSISLRFTDRDVNLHNMVAGSGDGVSKKIDDWILFDMEKTKKDCVLHSFIGWTYYRDRNIEDLLEKTHREKEKIKEKYKQILKDKKEIHAPYRFNDMNLIQKHNIYIITNITDLRNYTASDTLKTCMYYYENNHCYLIMHKTNISGTAMRKLTRCIKTTVVSQCVKRYPSKKVRDYYTMDIESYRAPCNDNNKMHVHEPLLVGLFSSRYHQLSQFRGETAVKQSLSYLCKQNENCIVWAHNGGKYDWHFLLEELSDIVDTSLVEPVEIYDLNGALIQLQCYLPNGKILTFKDSYRLLPSSLSELGKEFNIKHQKLEDLNIEDATREEILSSPKILEYNGIDCIALYEVLENYKDMMTKTFDMNPLDYVSAASFAKNLFYTKYFDPRQYIMFVPSKVVYEFIKKGYGGGRNEVFMRNRVKGPMYLYDFTSLYPKAGTRMLPYGQPRHLESLEILHDEQYEFLTENPGFYEVHIKSPMNQDGEYSNVLPLHGVHKDGKYIFPIFHSEFETRVDTDVPRRNEVKTIVLFSEEIKKGLQLGYTYWIFQGYKFLLGEVKKLCFEDLFDLKKKAIRDNNNALAQALKITINSLYGFHGFHRYERKVLKIYGKPYEDSLVAKEMLGEVSYKQYGDVFLAEETVDVHLDNVNIAIAAAITSHARMILYDLIIDIHKAGGEVYYVDTDSVMTNYRIEDDAELKQKYLPTDGKGLGELRNELGTVDKCGKQIYANEAIFITCKTYGYTVIRDGNLETYVKTKGVKLSSIHPNEVNMVKPLPSEKEKQKELTRRRKEHIYKALKIMLFRSILVHVDMLRTSRRKKVSRSLQVYDITQKKIISGIYHKGKVLNDGKIVPFVVNQPQSIRYKLCTP